MTSPSQPARPWGVSALAVFFGFGAGISFVTFFALLFPGSFLEPMWRLNPRARESFGAMGVSGPVLMVVVSTACASAAAGLWRGRRWGHLLALALLTFSLLGDLANALLGVEPRAWAGVPVAALMLGYLATARVRAFFTRD
jgi:hypothetical protein